MTQFENATLNAAGKLPYEAFTDEVGVFHAERYMAHLRRLLGHKATTVADRAREDHRIARGEAAANR